MISRKLLAEARAAGIVVCADGDRLLLEVPRESLALGQRLGAVKWEILAVLAEDDPEVIWRLAAMRGRAGTRATLPFLTARDVPRETGGCRSCGEVIAVHDPGLAVVCAACRNAAWLLVAGRAQGLVNGDSPATGMATARGP